MKKIIILILILLLTGCTSYTELSDLSIVNAIGIDYKDNKFILTMNVINGELDDNKIEKELITYQSSGTTLDECFHNIYLNSNKRLYLSHIDILILTDDAINNQFSNIIKNFLDNNEYRNNFNVVLLNEINLTKFMNLQILSEDIINILNTNMNESGITVLKDFETIIKELLIDRNTYLPSISYKDDKLIVDGYTLIKNYKIYDKLTIKDSIILNFLNDKINKTFINDTTVFNNKTIVTSKNNNIYFKLITTINKTHNFKKNIIDDINIFLKKYQNNNYDILKLVDIVKKNDYQYYIKNKDLLKKLSFNISIEIFKKDNFLQGDLLYEK